MTILLFIILLYVAYRLKELQSCFEALYEDLWKAEGKINGLEFDVISLRNANYKEKNIEVKNDATMFNNIGRI